MRAVVLVLLGCHMPYHRTVVSRGPVALGGPRPLAMLTVFNQADPRGVSGPPADVGLVFKGRTIITLPPSEPELATLRCALDETASSAPVLATGTELVAVSALEIARVQPDRSRVTIASFEPPSVCPGGGVPRAARVTTACLSPNRARMAALRSVEGSCGSFAQVIVLALDGALARTDRLVSIPTPARGGAPVAMSCAVHDDGAMLVVTDHSLTAIDAVGTTTSQLRETKAYGLAPIAQGGYALLEPRDAKRQAIALVDASLRPTGHVEISLDGMDDRVVLTTDGTQAVALRTHDARLTVKHISRDGNTHESTLDLEPLAPPVVK